MMEKRVRFAEEVRRRGHSDEWFHDNLVWSDFCSSILPRSEKVAAAQALARKGKRGWGSKKSKQFSRNLRGSQEVLKQKGWGSERVWWVPILAKGKLHVEMLGADFHTEEPAGASVFVDAVQRGLAVRFQAGTPKPSFLFVDRGCGFWCTTTGRMTPELADALEGTGLSAFWGDDASVQPGYCADVMLHETAVAWIRRKFTETTPRRPWQETREQYAARLRRVVTQINSTHQVGGLCRKLGFRVDELIRRQGDRLRS
jgi:hypothetical protein